MYVQEQANIINLNVNNQHKVLSNIYSLSRSLSGSTNFIHYLLFLFYQENFWNSPQSYLHMTLTISAEIKHLGYTPYYVTFHPVEAHDIQWNDISYSN